MPGVFQMCIDLSFPYVFWGEGMVVMTTLESTHLSIIPVQTDVGIFLILLPPAYIEVHCYPVEFCLSVIDPIHYNNTSS